MSLAITPKRSDSTLEIDVVFNYALNQINVVMVSLFQDAGANALATTVDWVGAAGVEGQAVLHFIMPSGTTAATTFKVRAGGAAGTLTFNGISGGREFGGIYNSSIIITEIAP
jgi:hypothetical protein